MEFSRFRIGIGVEAVISRGDTETYIRLIRKGAIS